MTEQTEQPDQKRLQIAIPVFDRVTALDAIGPYDVLQRIPWVDIAFIGATRDSVRTDNGYLGIEVDSTYEEIPRARRHRVPRRVRHPRPRA